MCRMKALGIAIFVFFIACSLKAEVVDSSANGFTITNKITVKGTSQHAFDSIVKIGDWWSSAHTYSGNAKNMKIDLKAGGCFCELDGKQQVQHGTVVNINPGKLLRLSAALGPFQEQGVVGAFTFEIADAPEGATVAMTFRAGGYVPQGMDKIAPVVDQVLAEQIGRLKLYIETGKAEHSPQSH